MSDVQEELVLLESALGVRLNNFSLTHSPPMRPGSYSLSASPIVRGSSAGTGKGTTATEGKRGRERSTTTPSKVFTADSKEGGAKFPKRSNTSIHSSSSDKKKRMGRTRARNSRPSLPPRVQEAFDFNVKRSSKSTTGSTAKTSNFDSPAVSVPNIARITSRSTKDAHYSDIDRNAILQNGESICDSDDASKSGKESEGGSWKSKRSLHQKRRIARIGISTPPVPQPTKMERLLLLKMSPRERSIDMDARAEAENERILQMQALKV